MFTQKQLSALSEVAEIKRIYSVVERQLSGFKGPSCVVTSAEAQEGKTSLLTLLALTAASYGEKKVLAVDFNWYRPCLHLTFGVEQEFDLPALLEGQELEAQVQKTPFPNVEVITAPQADQGTKSTAAAVVAGAVKILNEAKKVYDLVLVDTAAIYPANRNMVDPVVISAEADGVIVSVLGGVSPRQQVKRSIMALETAGANVVGTVLNQWRNPIF